jgi:L-ribulose-5-phosphate 3-epimerase
MMESNQPTNTPSRREFLGSATAAGAAAAALMTASQLRAADANADATAKAPEKPKRALKKAIMFGMLQMEGSLVDKFTALKQCGFDGVELNAPGQHKAEEVNEACKQSGLEIEGVVDAFHWNVNLADPDPKIRAAAVEHLKGAIRDCKAFGGTSVLLVPAVVNKQVAYDDAWKRSQEEIRKAIPTAQETGVKIAIENVWNWFLLSPLEAVRYVDAFESPMVGWHFDIGNILNVGWPEQWIKILGARTLKLHIKEYSRKKRDQQGMGAGFGVDLLDGDNDWAAIMKALDAVGYNTWACAEVAGGGVDRMKVVAEKMDRILRM